MARGLPSMTALALAGYQNRDKISEMLKGATAGGAPKQTAQGGLGGLLGSLAGNMSSGVLLGGSGALLEAFRQNGQGDAADAWVAHGPNRPIQPTELKQAIGPEVLSDLAHRTGLPEEEILSRLSNTLPDAVDKYTPDGNLPAA